MSEQQLKQLLYNVLERKNKTTNTIYNDSKYVKQLKTMVGHLSKFGYTFLLYEQSPDLAFAKTLRQASNQNFILHLMMAFAAQYQIIPIENTVFQ